MNCGTLPVGTAQRDDVRGGPVLPSAVELPEASASGFTVFDQSADDFAKHVSPPLVIRLLAQRT
jgi:hypothetical protein